MKKEKIVITLNSESWYFNKSNIPMKAAPATVGIEIKKENFAASILL